MAVAPMRDDVNQFKRGLILRAAADLFFERGYTATTVEAMTERLSVSKTAIYAHFRSKTEILAAICQQAVTFSVELAERAAAEPGSAADRLRRLARDFTLIVIDHQDYIAITARELGHLPEADRKRIREMQEQFDHLLAGILREGSAKGEFDLKDPGLAALAIGGMIIWVHTWYRTGGRLTAAEIAETIADQALRMVA